MRVRNFTLGLIAVGFVSSASISDDEKRYPESQYRHHMMEQVKYSALPLLEIVKGTLKEPGGGAIHNATVLESAVRASIAAFKKDTRGMEGHSDSKDKVWANWEDFSTRMGKLHADTIALKAAVAGGDAGMIKGATFKVFKNCKSCHDEYRKEDH